MDEHRTVHTNERVKLAELAGDEPPYVIGFRDFNYCTLVGPAVLVPTGQDNSGIYCSGIELLPLDFGGGSPTGGIGMHEVRFYNCTFEGVSICMGNSSGIIG